MANKKKTFVIKVVKGIAVIIAALYILKYLSVYFYVNGIILFKSSDLKNLEGISSMIQLTTGREVKKREQDKGKTLGMPDYAEIFIVYEPVKSYVKQDIYNELVNIFKENGWEQGQYNIAPDYYQASMKQKYHNIVVSILAQPDEDRVSVWLNSY